MTLEELRSLKSELKRSARQRSLEERKLALQEEMKYDKNAVLEKAIQKHLEKCRTTRYRGSRTWNIVGFKVAASMLFTAGSLFVAVSVARSGVDGGNYKPSVKALATDDGGRRNALDFVKTLVHYGDSKLNFDSFIDRTVPNQRSGEIKEVFHLLKESGFEADCVKAPPGSDADFKIGFSSSTCSGSFFLSMTDGIHFKIIDLKRGEYL